MLDGRFVIRDCLGRGSYSEVYVADDRGALNGAPRTVVIKALNTHLRGVPDPELERTLIENFRNEAVALDRVRHPNIISRLGHGTAIDLQGRTFHYLVLEYLPGGDLQALVLRRPLPLDDALFYLGQVCAGLAYAHQHGVIHRDIKPQNLLLTADQRTLKIADFGVAKIEATEGAITRVGTEVYAAPEHHPLATTGPLDTTSLTRRVAQLTPAADIYSLAKTTYMLLTGESPRRFSQRPVTSLPEGFADAEWSRYVLRVLERATQTNPEKRYQTVEEFWRDIKDATMAQTRPLNRGEGGGSPAGASGSPGEAAGPRGDAPAARPDLRPCGARRGRLRAPPHRCPRLARQLDSGLRRGRGQRLPRPAGSRRLPRGGPHGSIRIPRLCRAASVLAREALARRAPAPARLFGDALCDLPLRQQPAPRAGRSAAVERARQRRGARRT